MARDRKTRVLPKTRAPPETRALMKTRALHQTRALPETRVQTRALSYTPPGKEVMMNMHMYSVSLMTCLPP